LEYGNRRHNRKKVKPLFDGSPYDTFTSEEVDPDRWATLVLTGQDGSRFEFLDTNAEVSVRGGIFEVSIPCFSLNHDSEQMLDNGKSLFISTHQFKITPGGSLEISASVSAEPHGQHSGGYRDGVVSLTVLNTETGAVFDWFVASSGAYALHERLPISGPDDPECFSHVIENPLARQSDTSIPHRYTVRLNPTLGRAQWLLDGQKYYEVQGRTDIPSAVRIGLGIFTLLPLVDGSSTCIRGQGMTGRWSELSISGSS
jgi:hypothetical protein